MGGMVKVMFASSRYEAAHVTLKELIREAYGVEDIQIQNDPKWMDSDTFTVNASVDNATLEALAKLAHEQRKVARQHMLQALLTDRFHLVLKQETKELPIYSLTVAKDGPNLRNADPKGTYENGVHFQNGGVVGPHVVYYEFIAGAIKMKGQGASMDQLVERMNQKLSGQLGRKFVNNTAIAGNYDFDLDFKVPWLTAFGPMANSMPLSDDGTASPSSEFSLFSAMQEQLGLKLKSTKGPVQILSIVHVEQPSEN
jgi:uncharacterized protein (TIGR03435 family)